MEVWDVLLKVAKGATTLAAANVNIWTVLFVCVAWVLVERMRCSRDIEVASIEHGKVKSKPPDKHTRSNRHKKKPLGLPSTRFRKYIELIGSSRRTNLSNNP